MLWGKRVITTLPIGPARWPAWDHRGNSWRKWHSNRDFPIHSSAPQPSTPRHPFPVLFWVRERPKLGQKAPCSKCGNDIVDFDRRGPVSVFPADAENSPAETSPNQFPPLSRPLTEHYRTRNCFPSPTGWENYNSQNAARRRSTRTGLSPDAPRGFPPRRLDLGMAAACTNNDSARLLLALPHRVPRSPAWFVSLSLSVSRAAAVINRWKSKSAFYYRNVFVRPASQTEAADMIEEDKR